MTGLAVATAVLTLGFYVALRLTRPAGLSLDPWPYIMRMDRRQRFERMLPMDPDDPICDREPPRDLVRGLELMGQRLTRCMMQPHGHAPGTCHIGVLIERGKDPTGPLMQTSYTWLEDPRIDAAAAAVRRRPPRWRVWLIRLATS